MKNRRDPFSTFYLFDLFTVCPDYYDKCRSFFFLNGLVRFSRFVFDNPLRTVGGVEGGGERFPVFLSSCRVCVRRLVVTENPMTHRIKNIDNSVTRGRGSKSRHGHARFALHACIERVVQTFGQSRSPPPPPRVRARERQCPRLGASTARSFIFFFSFGFNLNTAQDKRVEISQDNDLQT